MPKAGNASRQAIVTKYHGATDSRGSRISAKAAAGQKFYPWDHELGSEENHFAAALQYANEKGWLTGGLKLYGGGMPDGSGNVYVLA